jgi:putative SOS response-associated peptidase YedK
MVEPNLLLYYFREADYMVIIGQVSGKAVLESHFDVAFKANRKFAPAYFIDREETAWVISCRDNKAFTRMRYGMVPFWSDRRMLHFEAPVEGNEQRDNEKIKKQIILHPVFRRPIRESRCLVPLDYFILVNALKNPYVFFSCESRPFALAGLFDTWSEQSLNNPIYEGFSIITLPAGPLASGAGITRFPLILPVSYYKRWLKSDAHLSEITALLKPVDDTLINGYSIRSNLFRNKRDMPELLKSAGGLLRRDQTTDTSGIVSFLKSFRYKRGLTHPRNDQEQRVWRGKN